MEIVSWTIRLSRLLFNAFTLAGFEYHSLLNTTALEGKNRTKIEHFTRYTVLDNEQCRALDVLRDHPAELRGEVTSLGKRLNKLRQDTNKAETAAAVAVENHIRLLARIRELKRKLGEAQELDQDLVQRVDLLLKTRSDAAGIAGKANRGVEQAQDSLATLALRGDAIDAAIKRQVAAQAEAEAAAISEAELGMAESTQASKQRIAAAVAAIDGDMAVTSARIASAALQRRTAPLQRRLEASNESRAVVADRLRLVAAEEHRIAEEKTEVEHNASMLNADLESKLTELEGAQQTRRETEALATQLKEKLEASERDAASAQRRATLRGHERKEIAKEVAEAIADLGSSTVSATVARQQQARATNELAQATQTAANLHQQEQATFKLRSILKANASTATKHLEALHDRLETALKALHASRHDGAQQRKAAASDVFEAQFATDHLASTLEARMETEERVLSHAPDAAPMPSTVAQSVLPPSGEEAALESFDDALGDVHKPLKAEVANAEVANFAASLQSASVPAVFATSTVLPSIASPGAAAATHEELGLAADTLVAADRALDRTKNTLLVGAGKTRQGTTHHPGDAAQHAPTDETVGAMVSSIDDAAAKTVSALEHLDVDATVRSPSTLALPRFRRLRGRAAGRGGHLAPSDDGVAATTSIGPKQPSNDTEQPVRGEFCDTDRGCEQHCTTTNDCSVHCDDAGTNCTRKCIADRNCSRECDQASNCTALEADSSKCMRSCESGAINCTDTCATNSTECSYICHGAEMASPECRFECQRQPAFHGFDPVQEVCSYEVGSNNNGTSGSCSFRCSDRSNETCWLDCGDNSTCTRCNDLRNTNATVNCSSSDAIGCDLCEHIIPTVIDAPPPYAWSDECIEYFDVSNGVRDLLRNVAKRRHGVALAEAALEAAKNDLRAKQQAKNDAAKLTRELVRLLSNAKAKVARDQGRETAIGDQIASFEQSIRDAEAGQRMLEEMEAAKASEQELAKAKLEAMQNTTALLKAQIPAMRNYSHHKHVLLRDETAKSEQLNASVATAKQAAQAELVKQQQTIESLVGQINAAAAVKVQLEAAESDLSTMRETTGSEVRHDLARIAATEATMHDLQRQIQEANAAALAAASQARSSQGAILAAETAASSARAREAQLRRETHRDTDAVRIAFANSALQHDDAVSGEAAARRMADQLAATTSESHALESRISHISEEAGTLAAQAKLGKVAAVKLEKIAEQAEQQVRAVEAQSAEAAKAASAARQRKDASRAVLNAMSASRHVVLAGTMQEMTESAVKREQLQDELGGETAQFAEEEASEPIAAVVPALPFAESGPQQPQTVQTNATASGTEQTRQAAAARIEAESEAAAALAATDQPVPVDEDAELARLADVEDAGDDAVEAESETQSTPAEREAEQMVRSGGNASVEQIALLASVAADSKANAEAMQRAVVEPAEITDMPTDAITPVSITHTEIDTRLATCRAARCSPTATAASVSAACVEGMATSPCE